MNSIDTVVCLNTYYHIYSTPLPVCGIAPQSSPSLCVDTREGSRAHSTVRRMPLTTTTTTTR